MLKRKAAFQPFLLHTLPLAIGALIVTTLIPVEMRTAVWWDGGFDAGDFIQNVCLFAPLGIALNHRRLRTVLLVAFALSATAEFIQVWSFERFSSPFDVVANVVGAALAWWIRRRFFMHRPHDEIRAGAAIVGLACVAAMAQLVLWQAPRSFLPMSNWDSSYSLLLGNEVTRNRPWHGTIERLEIVSGALSENQIRSDAADSHQRFYRLEAPAAIVGLGVRLPQRIADQLAADLRRSPAFSVIARITPRDLEQEGPARIVSFSRNTIYRNFDLGQERDGIVFRLRNPRNDVIDQDFRLDTGPVLTGKSAQIVATFDGAIARIFVDGRPAARMNLAATTCVAREVCDSALAAGWSILGGAAALFALALSPARSARNLWLVGGTASLVVLLLPRLFGWIPAALLDMRWMQAGAVCGVVAVVLARAFARDGTDAISG